jgi:hypothetical protein
MNLYEDRIADFLDACFRAGLKDPVRFLESKRVMVFDWLKGCFPRNILPTDIDGEVELNGRFLRLEFKDEHAMRGCWSKSSQRLALERLANTGAFTVFIVGVDQAGEPKCIEIFKSNGKHSGRIETSKEDMRSRCKAWADWAQQQPVWKKTPNAEPAQGSR